MQKADVILTEGGNSVGYQIARSLSEKGLRVIVCDTSSEGVTFHSRFVVDSFICRAARDERTFIRQILAAAEESGARLIIPVFHPEVLSRHRDEFNGAVIPTDAPSTLQMLDDKVSFSDFVSTLGLRQPHVYASIDEITHYPVVFKRSGGQGGDSVYFPKTRESLQNLVRNSVTGKYIITDEIEGADVSVDALRWGGQFYAGAYEVLMPHAKGVSILRRSIDAPELVETARKILDAADFNGVCGFDFRVDASGKAWLLEANPRFSGGLASQIASGLDLPWILYNLATGGTDEADTTIARPGVITRSAGGTVDYLRRPGVRVKATKSELLRLIFPFGSRRTDDVTLSDPKSILWIIRKIFSGKARRG